MRYILILVLATAIVSCNSSEEIKISPKARFDQLESVFSTANWKLLNDTGSSFLYFSRLGDFNYTVYDYTLVKGDSSVKEISTMTLAGDTILWNHPADTLKLIEADSTMSKWAGTHNPATVYLFTKNMDGTLSADLGGKKLTLKQTLPLATFLVRSHYDFQNGTHTVDSPLVKHRGRDL